jgi:hypothetical protein
MIKKMFFPLMISLLSTIHVNAEWIPVSKDKTTEPNKSPKVTIISDDYNATVISLEIYGFELTELISEGKSYQSVDLLTEMFTNESGSPELAYISKILAIPDEASISYDIIKIGEIQTFENIHIKPAQKSMFEGMPETGFLENNDIYESSDFYPNQYAQLESPKIFRDFRITRLSIYPMRYISSRNELEVVTSMTIRINYGSGKTENIKTTDKKDIAPSFGSIYRNTIFNYKEVLDRAYGGKEAGHDLMLCIMPDIFYDSFQTYAEWKRQSGIDIHITKFSDIGANGTNPITIKNHITDAYHNWAVPPTYVLIVGDDGVFPKKIVTLDGWSFPNEDFFVEIDGNDFFPEMMIGRFTNQEDYRMQVMINKFLKYETEPYTEDPEWFKKGVCCSNNAQLSQVTTKRFTRDVMLYDGGFTSVDTLMSDGDPYYGIPCSMDNSDVINAINDGRSYLNYRGEGWSSGWWANCTPLQTSDISTLNNGEKLTFVTSIGCGVAMFDAPGGNCFGEEWVEMGTLTNPKGGVAFIGPTSNTHTTYNNKIDKGIYVGMFREAMDTPGQALLRGKLYLYNVYGTDPYVEYHYKIYCVLGDPSIHIWKDFPSPVVLEYETNNNIVDISVYRETINTPLDSVQVTITGPTFFSSNYTDESGMTSIEIPLFSSEELQLTVRGRTVIPHTETFINDIGIQTIENTVSVLKQNVPNPFTKNTQISYIISRFENVILNIYDIRGQLIRTLQNGHQSPGEYSVEWDGINNNGIGASPGIYYYTLETETFKESKKMLKL